MSFPNLPDAEYEGWKSRNPKKHNEREAFRAGMVAGIGCTLKLLLTKEEQREIAESILEEGRSEN